MKKLLNGLLALILIVIIVGGLGYIGYSYLFMNHGTMSSTHGQSEQADTNTHTSNTNQTQHGMQPGGMNMNGQAQQQPNAMTLDGVKIAMSDKASLDTAVAALNEAIGYLTLDPYGPNSNTGSDMKDMNQTQTTHNMPMPETPAPADTAAPADQAGTGDASAAQENTTINVFPPASTQTAPQQDTKTNKVMQDMGTRYDANKMEQLHSGLYKLAVGMQLLEQLDSDLTIQAESANANVQDLAQYYSNQYTLLLQNKNKLNQALNSINEAANLVNINPYISGSGLVYDKDRMQKIHESIFKMAEGVAALNKLNDEMTTQAVMAANMAQSYMNNPNLHTNHNASSTSLLGGLFGGINLTTIVNIILILFVTAFILAIFGFIFSLLKRPSRDMRE